jgi:hypothetical protein
MEIPRVFRGPFPKLTTAYFRTSAAYHDNIDQQNYDEPNDCQRKNSVKVVERNRKKGTKQGDVDGNQ